MKKNTIFENFLEQCNPKVNKEIKKELAKSFDINTRKYPLNDTERRWIKKNLHKNNQIKILGNTLNELRKKGWEMMDKKKCLGYPDYDGKVCDYPLVKWTTSHNNKYYYCSKCGNGYTLDGRRINRSPFPEDWT